MFYNDYAIINKTSFNSKNGCYLNSGITKKLGNKTLIIHINDYFSFFVENINQNIYKIYKLNF